MVFSKLHADFKSNLCLCAQICTNQGLILTFVLRINLNLDMPGFHWTTVSMNLPKDLMNRISALLNFLCALSSTFKREEVHRSQQQVLFVSLAYFIASQASDK